MGRAGTQKTKERADAPVRESTDGARAAVLPEEIDAADLPRFGGDAFTLIDLRDPEAFACGHIPGARNIPLPQLREAIAGMRGTLCLVCRSGETSLEAARALRETGIAACSLRGGYLAWLRAHIGGFADSEIAERAEQSIRKKFHKQLFAPFAKAIMQYELLAPNDRVAVCISGGKDSMLMAKLFQELQRHRKFPFELVFLVMDPGYSKENRELIEANARLLGIPITVFGSDIFENVYEIEKSPCYVCARMRRGYLYSKAQALGCNKIALGHHYDDVIETILMGMLYSGQVQTMMPKLRSKNFAGMELIRPMYLIREADIKAWRDRCGLHFLQCACRFTDTCNGDGCTSTGSKRKVVKELIRTLAAADPVVEQNIFKSVENVNLKAIVAYKDALGVRHTFFEHYSAPAADE